MKDVIHRRAFLKRFGLGAAAAAAVSAGLPGSNALGADSPAAAAAGTAGAAGAAGAAGQGRQGGRKRLLRVGHLTDCHIQPERDAAEGVAACLRHVQSQADKPEMLLVTGDCVMDSFKQDEARTKIQWDLWKQVWRAENGLPVKFAIGNHDVWGWNKALSRTTGSELLWGKRRACENLALDRSYHSFDRNGWHFIALDSIFPFEDQHYTAKLDEAQFDWLQSDLKATDPRTPVLVMSHIPIITVTALVPRRVEDRFAETMIGHGSMHNDWRRLRNLFARHPNVKVAISGHTHFVDRVENNGVTYLCNGAVSGGWWKGSHRDECDAGYALLDLYDDGTVDRTYVPFGWQYRPDPQPTS